MHDVIFNEHLEGGKKFVEVQQGLFFIEFSFRLDFLFESSLIAEFVDKIIIVGGFENFDETNDMS